MQTAAPEKAKVIGGEFVAGTEPRTTVRLIPRVAARFGVEPDKLLATLKATAFRQRPDKKTGEAREPTNEEMMALLVLVDKYGLDPFRREIFAFLDPKSGAIVPIVSVDGWIRIINEQPTLRSLSFVQSAETLEHKNKTVHQWMECEVVRSDRDKPIIIREYFDEVVRITDYGTPWDSHPNRMHRHKVLIQCARVAFGFAGIFDEDEAQRIIEGESMRVPEAPKAITEINEAVSGLTVNGEVTAKSPSAAGEAVASSEPQGKQAATATAASVPGVTKADVLVAISKIATATDRDLVLDLMRSLKTAEDEAECGTMLAKKDQELAAKRK